MVDPSLLISIDRTALELPPLVLSARRDANPLGIVEYVEPAQQARIRYAPASNLMHGEVPLAWSWQQSLLNFTVAASQAASESASRSLITELRTAITQGLEFAVTVTVSDAPAESWVCNPGSLSPAGSRSLVNLRYPSPEWTVSIPCHPVRSVA